jgi:hypothetical protein
MKALEKEPARRHQTAAEMARALPSPRMLEDFTNAETLGSAVRVATDGAPGGGAARPFGTTPGAEEGARKGKAMWIVGAAVVVAVAMVAVAVGMKGGEKPDPSTSTSTTTSTTTVPESSTSTNPAPTTTTSTSTSTTAPEVVSLGKLDVRAEPSGAKVYVDDVYKGPSPVLIANVPDGSHHVRIEKDGYQTLSMEVFVTGGKTTLVNDALPQIGQPSKVRGTDKPKVRGTDKPKVEKPETEPAVEKPKKPRDGRPGEKPNPYD